LLVHGTIDLPAAAEEELYRIAQEALNNALKHAAPASVTVRICADEETVVLEVSDDGCGFDLGAIAAEGGMGLVSMRERTEKLGGKLDVKSRPGEGTSVSVSLEVAE
jgi:signal transduction histidine kinase